MDTFEPDPDEIAAEALAAEADAAVDTTFTTAALEAYGINPEDPPTPQEIAKKLELIMTQVTACRDAGDDAAAVRLALRHMDALALGLALCIVDRVTV